MIVFIIVTIAIIFQMATVIVSLYSTKLSGPKLSWLLIAMGITLMSVRRIIPWVHMLSDEGYQADILQESIGLVISALMFFGFIGIRKILLQWYNSKKQIQQLLTEKEFLLKEVHHRIKNNIASIENLFTMYGEEASSPSQVFALNEASGLLASMRILYEKMLCDEEYRIVRADSYLNKLIDAICPLYPDTVEDIEIKRDLMPIMLPAKKIFLLGIIVNEFMTNSFKYAFTKNKKGGYIAISIRENKERITLVVEDNGSGTVRKDSSRTEGFGYAMIKMLATQLEGEALIDNSNGTRFELSIAAFKG